MRLGVALPFHAVAIADAARAAERHGFDSVWVLDAHNRGFMLPDPFVALAIAASVTERVEVGSSIIQVPLRPPFLLAEQVGSVSAAARGRFLFGVGAGSTPGDFAAFGLEFANRFRLLDRNLAITRRLLRGEEVDGTRLSPWESVSCPPILVGTYGGSRWLRRAATDFDGWIASARSTELPQMVEGLQRFRELGGGKRAIAANLAAARPDAADILAALAEAGFDDATLIIERHTDENLAHARSLFDDQRHRRGASPSRGRPSDR